MWWRPAGNCPDLCALLHCSARPGPAPALAVILGIAERFCCSANYKVPESHSALLSGMSFPGGQRVPQAWGAFPELLFRQHPRVWWSQGMRTPCPVPCSPCCPQLPAILLAIASVQLLAPVTMNRSSHTGASVSPDTGPCGWEDEKCPWSRDFSTSSAISPLLADLVLAGLSKRL